MFAPSPDAGSVAGAGRQEETGACGAAPALCSWCEKKGKKKTKTKPRAAVRADCSEASGGDEMPFVG